MSAPVRPRRVLAAACAAGAAFVAGNGLAADAGRGRELLARYQCGSCHVLADAVSSGQPVAPPLTRWGRRSYIAGVLPNDEATLARWLQDPPALVPATRMPVLGVCAQDARDIAAHLMAQR
jgi:cytochrome c